MGHKVKPVRVLKTSVQLLLTLPFLAFSYLMGGKPLVLASYVGILHNHKKWLLDNPHLPNQKQQISELEKDLEGAEYRLWVLRGGEVEEEEEPSMKN